MLRSLQSHQIEVRAGVRFSFADVPAFKRATVQSTASVYVLRVKVSCKTMHDVAYLDSRLVQILVAETEDNDALLHMAQSTR